MKFDELSEEAQERALDNLREPDYEWWDDFEFFTTLCETLGVVIETHISVWTGKDKKGHSREHPKIYFSGFYSQGDSSGFYSSVHVRSFIQAIKKKAWKKEFPKLKCILKPIPVHKNILKLMKESQIDVRCYTAGDQHHLSVNFNWQHYLEGDRARLFDVWITKEMEQLERDVTNRLRTLNEYLFDTLREQYEYLTSDEAVRETIEANEYEFDEEGDLV